MIMDKRDIKKAIYTWGVYPALMFLKENQELENFEVCADVKNVLDEICSGREWYLSTSLEPENLKQTMSSILEGRNNKDLIRANMPYYIDEFRNFLNEKTIKVKQ